MHYLKIIIALVVFLNLVTVTFSQIIPPEFVCIKDDTLFWNPAVNTCGPFVSVDIYKSNGRNGPYALLASVMDISATWYVDNDQSSSFYYLESNHSCVTSPISSDTLSNQFQQLVTKIERVTVQGSDVEISWYDNGSAQTVGYIIYRITDQGTLPIDTVFSGLRYTDVSATPTEKVESYYVLGMNSCGGTNTFDANAHSTILLSTEVDFCDQHIKLTWNSYESWENGIENNQIWLGINGQALAFEHQISDRDTLAYITGVLDQSEYCISIMAKENGRNVTSASNVKCVIAEVLSPLTQLMLLNVSVDDNEDLVIDWKFNSNADLAMLQMQRGDDSIFFSDLESISLPSGSDLNQLIDPTAKVQERPYFYQLFASDDCDSTTSSNFISSVHLRLLSAQDGENQVAWSPLLLSGRTVDGYEVCRINQGVEESLGMTKADQRFVTDQVAVDARSEIACYVVKALHVDASGADPRISRSNTICVEQNVEVYVPNAFVPEGINQIYLPQFLNRPASGYTMTIFNRWGGKVFETTNPDLGWNGNHDGDMCPGGVYLYQIQFAQPDGSQEILNGSVTLIR